MMKNFWQKLKKPFFVLAPMADVTDVAFREIIAKYSKHGTEGGGPDVFWTEFVSADGLCNPTGRGKLLIDLAYTEAERPIVTQLFSSKPENMRQAAKIVCELGFDGIDINMGCPDKSVEKQGAGANLIKNPKLAQEIIKATMDGAGGLPVSVKTRIGYHQENLEEWLGALLEAKPATITIHARTRKEMSKVPARWEEVARAVKLARGSGTLIIGNGDVKDMTDARAKARQTGADGIMLGRAIFGNPWLFANSAHAKRDCRIEHPAQILPRKAEEKREIRNRINIAAQSRNRPNPPTGGECAASAYSCNIGAGSYIPTTEERLRVMVEHTKLFEEMLGSVKNFAVMKKHFKAYAEGFPGAKDFRIKLMETKNAVEVEGVANKFLGGVG